MSTNSEFDALARVAAGLLDAPVVTISELGPRVVRLAGSGATWPLADEAPFLKSVADAVARDEAPVITIDLAAGDPASEQLYGDGIRRAWIVPLRDGGTALGVIAAYARTPVTPSSTVRRGLIDLGEVALAALVGRRELETRRGGERALRLAGAMADVVRAPNWRAAIRIALDALGATRGSRWALEGDTVIERDVWDQTRQYAARHQPLRSDAPLLAALRIGDVIDAADAKFDPRTRGVAEAAGQVASLLIAPVLMRGQAIGALALEYAERRHWRVDEIKFASTVGAWLAPLLALEDARAPSLTDRRVLAHVDNTPDLVVITDDFGRVVFANEAATQLGGALIGRTVDEFSAPEFKGLPGMVRMRETGHDVALEGTFTRHLHFPSGAEKTVEIASARFAIDGAYYVGHTARDPSRAMQRLDETMRTVSMAIAHVTLDGKLQRFNDALVELTGCNRSEVFGNAVLPVLQLEGKLDLASLRAHLATATAPYELEYELTRPDGTVAWVELSISMAKEAGRPAYFVVVAREMTGRRRADMMLRHLAETLAHEPPALYQQTCKLLADGFAARYVVIGRLAGTTLVPLAARINGEQATASDLDIVGTPCELVPRNGIAHYPSGVRQLYPDDKILAGIDGDAYLAAPMLGKNGETLGLVIMASDRAFDPALPIEHVVKVCATRIASELQREDATNELVVREEALRQITEGSQEVFWLSKWPSRELIFASAAFESLTGRTVASLYENRASWGTGLHPDDKPRVEAAMRDLEKAPADVTARVIRPDGQLRWIQIRASLVHDRDGRAYRIVGCFEDITALKEVQRALEDRERQLHEALASSEREVESLQRRLGEQDQLRGMIGSSQVVRTVYRRLRQAAQSDVTVLIAGESGTGKELAARALHELSVRANKPFVAINCAAIPESLLESELFGHVKGAFTGASRDKVGLMQAAEGGTLFLDEIGDMSLMLQVKMLRALQERQIRRVGDEKPIPVDVRIVSASHRDLRALVAGGRMREDFYYRIKVFEIEMPSLRERREDIPALAQHFAAELGRASGRTNLSLSAEALRALLGHRWPGNVRELRNAIEHALVTVQGSVIQLSDLPLEVRGAPTDLRVAEALPATPATPATPVEPAATPREQIEDALRRSGGNRAEAARMLGIGRVTLWKRMRRLGMTTSGEAPPPDDR